MQPEQRLVALDELTHRARADGDDPRLAAVEHDTQVVGQLRRAVEAGVVRRTVQVEDGRRAGVEAGRDPLEPREQSFLRLLARATIGVHAGPAIAVTANGRLDYFGRTVNMAARVAATGEAGAVVMLADLAEQPAVRERLEREAEPAGTLTATLRGVSRPCALVRVRPRGRGAEAAPASGPDVSAARTGGAA
jgi:adenylate cyclase